LRIGWKNSGFRLVEGERIRFVGRLHWMIYDKSILYAALAAAVAIGSTLVGDGPQQFVVLVVAGLLLVIAVRCFLAAWFRRVTTEIVVTDKRVIHKQGWISRRTEEMNITKVETVDVEQRLGGRILGYGTVRIRGVGGGLEPLSRVDAPLALRNAILVG
jgi:uncharacterized membrane protein YdbT with pleckstrin-like domain